MPSLAKQIAIAINARETCLKHGGNGHWGDTWTERLNQIARSQLPSGSGFDSGTRIDLDASTEDKIVLTASFHHMNDGGFYDGWTEHRITVRPSLIHGFTLTVSGSNRNDIKDYIRQTFEYDLAREYEFPAPTTASASV